MLITRISKYSKIERTIDLPVTTEQMNNFDKGMHVQNAFPQLTPDQREFILTGITNEEWEQMFPPEEEDDFIEDGDGVVISDFNNPVMSHRTPITHPKIQVSVMQRIINLFQTAVDRGWNPEELYEDGDTDMDGFIDSAEHYLINQAMMDHSINESNHLEDTCIAIPQGQGREYIHISWNDGHGYDMQKLIHSPRVHQLLKNSEVGSLIHVHDTVNSIGQVVALFYTKQ